MHHTSISGVKFNCTTRRILVSVAKYSIDGATSLGFGLETAAGAGFADIRESTRECNPLLLLLPTPLPSKQPSGRRGGYLLPEIGSFPGIWFSLLVFLKRWSSTSISTLMLLLGRWRTVFWGTMATVSLESLESPDVLVWLSTSDLESGCVGSATVTGGFGSFSGKGKFLEFKFREETGMSSGGSGEVGSLAAMAAS